MESIAVPVSVDVEVRPVGADIGSLERAISGALAEVARQLWAEVIAALERSLVVPRGHVGCGGILRANGRAPRRIVTLAGELELRRRRYRCGACDAEVVPLDEALGLAPRMQHTLGVRERALWLVTELSYAKSARTLDELRAVGVSCTSSCCGSTAPGIATGHTVWALPCDPGPPLPDHQHRESDASPGRVR